MIVDFRSLENNNLNDFDLCIVGAGAAGITIAHEFIGTDIHVCLLESGGLEYDASTQALAEGRNSGLPYFELITTRLRFFGGTTNHWEGMCTPLSSIDFRERKWVPYSGWPITNSTLRPYYKRAQRVCQLGPYQYGSEIWKKWGRTAPVFRPQKLVSRFWQFSPPTRFGRVYKDKLEKAGNVTVMLNANLTNIQLNEQGSAVVHVDLKALSGTNSRVRARTFVLCCGGIENARLLLVSNCVASKGVGNDNGIVGRFFMEHPCITCGIVVSDDEYDLVDRFNRNFFNGVQYRPGIVVAELLQQEEEILNCSATIDYETDPEDGTKAARQIWHDAKLGRVPPDLADKVWQIAKDLDSVASNVYRRFVRGKGVISPIKHLLLTARSEQAPNPGSRITLAEERDPLGVKKCQVDWRLTELDKRTIRKLTEVIGGEFGWQNLGRVRIEEWLLSNDDRWPSELKGQYHHMGGTRMADDPKRGVVDRNCRVHGIHNLFIAGGSIFPTSGYANPTLTIVALALRVADHLKTLVA